MDFESSSIKVPAVLHANEVRHLNREERVAPLAEEIASRIGIEERCDLFDGHRIDPVLRVGLEVPRGVQSLQKGASLERVLVLVGGSAAAARHRNATAPRARTVAGRDGTGVRAAGRPLVPASSAPRGSPGPP